MSNPIIDSIAAAARVPVESIKGGDPEGLLRVIRDHGQELVIRALMGETVSNAFCCTPCPRCGLKDLHSSFHTCHDLTPRYNGPIINSTPTSIGKRWFYHPGGDVEPC